MFSDLSYLFSIWFATLIIGFISWPSTAFFLGKLSDRGYAFSKIFGWIAISYMVFLLATLKIIPLTLWSIILVVFIWAGINAFIEKRFVVLRNSPLNFRQIIFTEALFIFLMIFWAFIRSFKPEIFGIERFMDFGFIQALFNAHTLPLFDVWFSGENLNYYYFGHFIGYIILSLSKIPPVAGFFVLVAWMFGLVGVLVYRLGADLSLPLKKGEEGGGRKGRGIVAGFISLFVVLFAGTWHTTGWLFSYMKHVLFGGPAPTFWFSDPTRIMPGTITEIPIYGFLVADLHPHMWGLLSGALVLAALYCAWLSQDAMNFKNKYLWFIAFLLGAAFMMNSWDAATLGALTAVVLVYVHFKKQKIKVFAYIALLAIFAYVVALPWSLFFSAPISGIGIVRDHSSIFQWLSFWGFLVSIVVVFIASSLLGYRQFLLRARGSPYTPLIRKIWTSPLEVAKIACSLAKASTSWHFIIVGLSMILLIFMELFYVKDILSEGEWFRANTVFKITSQLWLWLGVLSGSMIVWSIISLKNLKNKIILIVIYLLIFFGPAVYPIKAIWQFQIDDRRPQSFDSSLNWWKAKYPSDYAAYEYLKDIRDGLPKSDKVRRIVEADGESYTDHARFSVFLGWPSIIGWPVHEWTWRGSYTEVGSRRSDVRDIYTHPDINVAKNVLEKYKIDYIIVGELESQLYGAELKREKLKSLGEMVFENGKTMVLKVK